MIKLMAALFMLIDHVGMIFFSDIEFLRIIGRISMPLFAYCISRGFYYTNKKQTLKKYLKRLTIFSFVSQIPYAIIKYIQKENIVSLNIGFTWLLALILLYVCESYNKNLNLRQKILCFIIFVCIIILCYMPEISYGLSGVLYPVFFYKVAFKNDTNLKFSNALLVVIFLFLLYILQYGLGGLIQIYSIMAAPVLFISKKYDDKIKLPKKFFYIFYPLHLTIFLVIRFIMFMIYRFCY